MTVNIYLDMDDVVADWMGYARRILNHPLPVGGVRLPANEWGRLKDNQRMYRDLEVREGANELVDWCREYVSNNGGGLYFLTAIPRNNDMPYAVQDKVHWANKYFPDIPVFIGPRSHEKVIRCTGYDSILIDDRLDNCSQWIDAGGRAFQYKKWEDCKDWLENELI